MNLKKIIFHGNLDDAPAIRAKLAHLDVDKLSINLSDLDEFLAVSYTTNGITIYPEKEDNIIEFISLPTKAYEAIFNPKEGTVKFQHNEQAYCIYKSKAIFDILYPKPKT